MMEMVNGSRFGVALMGLGIHRRSFLEAAIYAARRTQWGRRIDEYPLVRETLVDLLVDLEAGMAVTYECAGSARAAGDADEARLLRRILIPLAKMRATRVALWAASTALEVFGGNGYMTDWPMARQLRDAQCHTIWEGTENILCLDVRRAMHGEQAHLALVARVGRALDAASGHKVLASSVDTVARRRWPTRSAPSTTSRASTTTCSSSTPGGWPSCWPTPPRPPSCSTRRRGPSTATETPARRWWPGGSSAAQAGRPPGPGHPGPRPLRPRPVRGDHPVRAAGGGRPGSLTAGPQYLGT